MELVSAIITTHNRKNLLMEAIKSVQQQTYSKIELIVVDDASDDGFDYEHLAEIYNAIYIEHKERVGVAASRDEAGQPHQNSL